MTHQTSLDDTHALLALLPLLGHIVATEVRGEFGEATTIPQFRVLAHLNEGRHTLSALARKRRVSIQAMCELVHAMVERGWVVRTPDPADRRQSLLGLTEVGRRHYTNAQERLVARLVPLLAALDPAEQAALRVALPALQRVLAAAEEQAADAD